MRYIVLLRGVNIGGKNKILMGELRHELERNNYRNVVTYLNSGNVILDSEQDNNDVIMNDIREIIKAKFNFDVPIFVMSVLELEEILNNSPDWWGTDNKEVYDNLIFIIPPLKYEDVYSAIGDAKEDIERIKGYNNFIFWSFDLKSYRKSNWWVKTASTSIKDMITIRTANTVKKLLIISKN